VMFLLFKIVQTRSTTSVLKEKLLNDIIHYTWYSGVIIPDL